MNIRLLFSYLKGRLFRQILLAVTAGVVLLCTVSIALTYYNFDRLGEDIGVTLATGQQNVDHILEQNRSHLGKAVDTMAQDSTASLSGYLSSNLKSELATVEETLHQELTEGVETLAVLLARFSHEAILGRNYSQLMNYAKIVSAQESVVYAVYLKPDGKPFTRYVNRADPRVKTLLNKGKGRTPLDKLLSAVDGDATIKRISREIRFEGKLLGRVELGVSMAAADQTLAAMKGRFAGLVEQSGAKVQEVLAQEGQALTVDFDKGFRAIKAQNDTSATSALEVIHSTAGSLLGLQVSVSAAAGVLILAGLLGFLLARVMVPVRRLTDTMQELASDGGDLTRELPADGKDEIAVLGRAFNQFSSKIRNIIRRAGETTQQLAVAAEQLAGISNTNNEGASDQRAETSQVATAITEMAATVKEVARSAEAASQAVKEADAQASEGKRVVEQTVTVIATLAQEVAQGAEVIDRLEADSTAIGAVLDVIRSIAEQTNLLALNAAIEAARAGEQGRGFAVVAEEVRTLASRTQESTQEIQSMIEQVQTGTREAVQVMKNGVGITQDTQKTATLAGSSLDSIVSTVGTITNMNTQIASAAEEQTVVAGDIDNSVTHISDLAAQAASGAEEVAQASRELAELSAGLQKIVGEFKVC